MNCYLSATLKALRKSILLIGYGNDLRSDDGVGQRVADAVAAWGVPNVRSLAVHQLTPELAETLATADLAIFVDAYPASFQQEVQVCPVELACSSVTMAHTSDPRLLLAMTQALYGHHPQAWWVTVPSVNFELGTCLSPVAERGMGMALEEINRLIGEFPLPNTETTIGLTHKSPPTPLIKGGTMDIGKG